MKNPKSQDNPWMIALYISGAGGLLAAYILIGFFTGRWLMNVLDGPRVWIAIGTLSGLFVGILNIALLIKKFLGAQA
ncbi:AtpZ/AtpI family protein [Paenibacillus solani]|uniref:AtpZ/AtpI family protein n=1 Tax=Paenibacillus solani TaxID=1705565 RepID=UPI003D277894